MDCIALVRRGLISKYLMNKINVDTRKDRVKENDPHGMFWYLDSVELNFNVNRCHATKKTN